MDCSSRYHRAQERTSVPPHPSANEELQQVPEQPPSSPLCIINITEAEPLKHKEDEENPLPGNNFLSVTDVHQEEKSDMVEEAVVLEGGPSPPPAQYHSPAFPPEAPSSRCAVNVTPVVANDWAENLLENRLVEWVEQQLMSRMIADMYRPSPPDPVQTDSTDHSEPEERSLTSDIVEAAGGGGLQLFIDSNISVDSALIRQLVNEVLTETVAQMLSRTNATNMTVETGLEMPNSEPTEDKQETLAPLVPTPVPTPQPSQAQLSRETTPAPTPPPSAPSSPASQESHQQIPAPEPVATPTATPEPPLPKESPYDAPESPSPPIWRDPDLRLDEERSEEQLESNKQLLVMSGEEEAPPACSPVPAPAQSLPSLVEPSPSVPASLSETCSSSSSSSGSSTVTAETEAALNHISEGELLITVNQLVPLKEGEGVSSFSSSLNEMEDMALDSSTVEQVGGHNLLLTLLTKMDQGVSPGGQRPQPEGSWGREEMEDEASVGEVRDYGFTKPQNQSRNPGGQDPNSMLAVVQPDTQNIQGGARKTGVYLPTSRPQQDQNEEDDEQTEESVNADADFSNNVF